MVTVEAFVSMIAEPAVMGACFLALAEKFLPVVPSSALLILLGTRAVTGPGDLAAIVAATTLGSTLGCLCLYALGKNMGEIRCAAFVAHHGRYLLLSHARYDQLVEAFRRLHFPVTLIGQTIPTARAIQPVLAGMFGMTIRQFILAVALGASIWNGGFLTIGYILHVAV